MGSSSDRCTAPVADLSLELTATPFDVVFKGHVGGLTGSSLITWLCLRCLLDDHASLPLWRTQHFIENISSDDPPWSRRVLVVYHKPQPLAQTAATELLDRIQKVSGLTLEMIAPLAGVSRRSLQSWRRGAAISRRKEERLRVLADEAPTRLVGQVDRRRSKRIKR